MSTETKEEVKCPQCGLGSRDEVRSGFSGTEKGIRFWCGSLFNVPSKKLYSITPVCVQLAQLTREVDAWRSIGASLERTISGSATRTARISNGQLDKLRSALAIGKEK